MAKITLVRMPSLFADSAVTLSATPPIGVAYLASNLRADGHDITVVDSIGKAPEQVYYYGKRNLYINGLTLEEILDAIPKGSKYIGLSFAFSHKWPLNKKICSAIKKRFPDSVLICGGEHATAMPDFCLKHSSVDYCVLGEGEETLRDLINALETKRPVGDVAGLALRDKSGKTIFTERRKRILAIDDILAPAWDLIPLENYLGGGYSFGVNIGRSMPIVATRGCPYQCTFCSNPKMWTTYWLARSPLKVIEEMQEYIRNYSIENFDFYDLTPIIVKDWIIEFCNLLIDRKLNITWQLPSGTRAETLDAEVTSLLYKSGCRNLSYSPESGSAETLKRIKKRVNLDKMILFMKHSVRNNLNVKANIVIGFPGERLKNILETYRFIIRMVIAGVHDLAIWTFVAYPGSEIFSNIEKINKIPTFTEDYFISLLSYSDLRKVISWNEHFSNQSLKYIRLFGLFLFYSTNYLLRPIRLFRTIRNLVNHKPQSRMEMIVEKAFYRHKKRH